MRENTIDVRSHISVALTNILCKIFKIMRQASYLVPVEREKNIDEEQFGFKNQMQKTSLTKLTVIKHLNN